MILGMFIAIVLLAYKLDKLEQPSIIELDSDFNYRHDMAAQYEAAQKNAQKNKKQNKIKKR